jgi:hypothetical protein
MIPAFGGIYKRERKKTDNWPVRITTKAAPRGGGEPVPETAPAEAGTGGVDV